jgi:hypothetical protein
MGMMEKKPGTRTAVIQAPKIHITITSRTLANETVKIHLLSGLKRAAGSTLKF